MQTIKQGDRVSVSQSGGPYRGFKGTVIGKRGNFWRVALDLIRFPMTDSAPHLHLYYDHELISLEVNDVNLE